MEPLWEAVREAFGGVLGHPVVALALSLGAAYVVVVWLATALWAFVDMRRRSPHLVAPYGAAALVIVASPLLFPLALLVLRVVRPDSTCDERRLATVRDRALRLEVDDPRCPGCENLVDEDWLICPACRRSLGHRCVSCGRTGQPDWELCAWCGTEFGTAPRHIAAARP